MNLDVLAFRVFNWSVGEWAPFDHMIRVLAGDHLVPMGATLSLVWLWLAGTSESERARFQRAALAGITALGITSGVVSLLAMLVNRTRPFAELAGVNLLFYPSTDPSFPAHPTAVIVALGTAIRNADRQLGNLVMTAGVAMGVARVIAGNAWPSDVLAGAVIGVSIGSVAHFILRRTEPIATIVTLLGFGTKPRSESGSVNPTS